MTCDVIEKAVQIAPIGVHRARAEAALTGEVVEEYFYRLAGWAV